MRINSSKVADILLVFFADEHRTVKSSRKESSIRTNVSDKMTRRQRNYAQCYVSMIINYCLIINFEHCCLTLALFVLDACF